MPEIAFRQAEIEAARCPQLAPAELAA
jgi:hypothetical protein